MKKIEWQEIEVPAENIFNIWVDHPEMKWAESAWKILDEQGMTKYTNQLEKQKVIINLLALGCLYHEFCQAAFDETSHLEYQMSDLLNSLEESDLYISTYFMGVILYSEFGFHDEEFVSKESEEELMNTVFFTAAQKSLPLVAKTLSQGLGSTSELFLSLWNANITDNDLKISHPDELIVTDGVNAYGYVESLTS